MKDRKPYVGAAMFYDRFTDNEALELAETLIAAEDLSRKEGPGGGSAVDDRARPISLASRMLRAVLTGHPASKQSA